MTTSAPAAPEAAWASGRGQHEARKSTPDGNGIFTLASYLESDLSPIVLAGRSDACGRPLDRPLAASRLCPLTGILSRRVLAAGTRQPCRCRPRPAPSWQCHLTRRHVDSRRRGSARSAHRSGSAWHVGSWAGALEYLHRHVSSLVDSADNAPILPEDTDFRGGLSTILSGKNRT